MRYGEIPVDYSTGIPNIDIPIYKIEGKQLSLPISISYHASGIKVHDIASEVGLGWVLKAGGLISRTTFDLEDEIRTGNRTYSNANQFLSAVPNIIYDSYDPSCGCYSGSVTLESYLDSRNNHEDLMSDRYSYSLPNGVSGVFRYNYPLEDTLVMLPYRPFKIDKEVITAQSEKHVKSITIRDDHGISYRYEKALESGKRPSEWFLTQMASADGTETITLTYTPQEVKVINIPTNSFQTPKSFVTYNCDPTKAESTPSVLGGVTSSQNYSQVLSSIESNNVLISFIYSNREDFNYLKRLTEVRVSLKDSPTSIKKRAVLNQSYFGNVGSGNTNNDKRLKLNSMSIYGETNSLPQTYSFTYDQSVSLPPYSSRSMDFWGYYNNNDDNNLIHNDFIPSAYKNLGYGGNRKADDGSRAKAFMLNEIRYPTGGFTKFEFERNYVNLLYYPDQGGYIGGFRVSKITNYTKQNEISDIKSYEYSNPAYNIVNPEFYIYQQSYNENYSYTAPQGWSEYCNVLYRRTILLSNPVISHDLLPGLPIMYSRVVEYNGTMTAHNGSIEYVYSSPDLLSVSGPVREYHTFHEDKGNYVPQMLSKVTKNSLNNVVSEERHKYVDEFLQPFYTGINITRTLTKGPAALVPAYVQEYIQSLKAHDTRGYQMASLLQYSVNTTYDQQDQTKYIRDSIFYTYNQHNLMVDEASKVSSSGENILIQYKYPFDFGTTEPYKTMQTNGYLTPIIEKTTYSENEQIQKIFTSYRHWNNNIIRPEFVHEQAGVMDPVKHSVIYSGYDNKGNPRSLKQEGGAPVSYLWGHNKTLPIAMIENASSFQQDYTNTYTHGSWSFTQMMVRGQNYMMGTFTLSQDQTVSIGRHYSKNNDHEASFHVSIYSAGYTLPQITDFIPFQSTGMSLTSSDVFLPAGTYTVWINAGYGVGGGTQYQHDIYFEIKTITEMHTAIPFYTSFEEETENVSTVQFKTGRKSHVGSYKLSLPPSSAVGYNRVRVSYWGKSSSASAWQYFEDIINLNSLTQHTIGSSMAFIDEVRVYPLDARMTTYTYDPFYRTPTSIMQPNNVAEYYNYDEFGRLREIYIMEGDQKQMVKTFQYNFTNQ